MNQPVPFFNIIRIPAGKETEVLEVWIKISNYMEASEGCVSTRLHRNLKTPSLLINNACFTSMEAFVELTKKDEFQALSQQLSDLGVEREAGVYEVVHAFEQG